MNIQFGNNKNNTNKVKKIYNQGNIITARHQTAKYPYKILSIKEFPKPKCEDILKERKAKLKINMIKSFSFIEDSKTGYNKKNQIKKKNLFNHSSMGNNKVLFTNNHNHGHEKIRKIFSASQRKTNLFSINNNDNDNEFYIDKIKKNNELLKKRGIEVNNDNKKKVSSYSMSKYIEKYIDKRFFNNKNKSNKSLNLITNNYSDIYRINNDDNTQVMQFLSEVINTEYFNNNNNNHNHNFNTTNNIIKKYNKNKNNITRNFIIKRYYKKNKNKIRLSYTKNTINELKPLIINFKEKFNSIHNKKEKNKNNNFWKYNIKNEIKLKKNKFSKNSSVKNHTENNILINNPLSIETNKKVEKIKNLEKTEGEGDGDGKKKCEIVSNNITSNIDKEKDKNKIIRKFKINNNKNKKKLRFSKDIKIKNKKKKIFKNNEVKNGFLNYVNKTKYYRGLKYGKNSDIYDYLITPKESEGITDEVTKNDYIEYKSINQ